MNIGSPVVKSAKLFQIFEQLVFVHTSCIGLKKSPLKPPPKNFMKFPVKGSIQYVSRQLADPYVKRRHQEGYRCRSVYKLKEMDDEYKIFKLGMSVIDLGAAPGSWSQVAVERVFCNIKNDAEEHDVNEDGLNGQVIAVDIQRFSPLNKVIQIVGDFTDIEIQKKVVLHLQNKKADVVLCDAAPKVSGHDCIDHLLILNLAAGAAQFALNVLKLHGTFICKVWDCPEVVKLQTNLKMFFKKVKRIKPPASRVDSLEFYLLCQKFKKGLESS